MNFCTYSSEKIIGEKITVDNIFIHEFMPYAPENCTKVYLYGLYICSNATSTDNSVERFSQKLGLPVNEIEDCFYYWKEQGLVQVLDTMPMQVKYLPVKNIFSSIRKYKLDKYENFNAAAQAILAPRMITPTEYSVYYDLIERDNFEPEALLMIIRYCVSIKKSGVGYRYIQTVAQNWAGEKVNTAEKVEERIKNYENLNTYLGALFKILHIKRQAYFEEKDLYNKWVKQGFTEDVILQSAKFYIKQKKVLGMEQLDKLFDKLFLMQLFSVQEINHYLKEQENLKDIAYKVLGELGLFYDNVDPVIASYINFWVKMGYDKQTLIEISKFCFSKGNKTLNSMNNIVLKLYNIGVVSNESLSEYFGELEENDKQIKALLKELGMLRNITQSDRRFYKTWTENWGISDELLNYAISLSKDKIEPIIYLNKILLSFKENNIQNIEEAKKVNPEFKNVKSTGLKGRSYSKSELNNLFDSIDEIEV